MKTKIEIGTQVRSNNGTGIITKIITKSTGYVEVTYTNGKVKKEMAFNLTSVDGDVLKSKPVVKDNPALRQYYHDQLCKNIVAAYDEERGYVTGHSIDYIQKYNSL